MQRVRLQDLAVVHQAADLLGGRREGLRADYLVERLARREMVAHRADSAEPLHHDRHFPVGPSLDELLEGAKFDDVQPRLGDVTVRVEQQCHLAMALDARERFDHYAAQGTGRDGGFQCGFVHVVQSYRIRE